MKTRARFPIYWAAAWALLMGCSSPETAPPRLDPGFRFSQLASHRMAVWPVKTLETDLDTRHVMLSEYGSREAFLKAFSQKLSGRLLAVSGGSSDAGPGTRGRLPEFPARARGPAQDAGYPSVHAGESPRIRHRTDRHPGPAGYPVCLPVQAFQHRAQG
jgi:hypothetical protein